MYLPNDKRKMMWRKHRERVKTARCMVDCGPPNLNALNFLRMTQMKTDGELYMRRMRENVGLIVNIANIMQNTGVINCFNDRFDMLPSSRNKLAMKRLVEIEKQNHILGQRIQNAQSVLKTRPAEEKKHTKDMIHVNRERRMEQFEVPEHIMRKYKNRVVLPDDPIMVFELFRPQIYMEIELVGFRPIGRLYFDLYTEAAPQIVCEFVRTCMQHNHQAFAIQRLFPNLWMDGIIMLGGGIKLGHGPNNVEYDTRALSHEAGRGILSFRTMYLQDLKPGPMDFSISFKPSPLFDKNRVCFGRVVAGWKVLDILRDYGMSNGRPKTPLAVSACGNVVSTPSKPKE